MASKSSLPTLSSDGQMTIQITVPNHKSFDEKIWIIMPNYKSNQDVKQM